MTNKINSILFLPRSQTAKKSLVKSPLLPPFCVGPKFIFFVGKQNANQRLDNSPAVPLFCAVKSRFQQQRPLFEWAERVWGGNKDSAEITKYVQKTFGYQIILDGRILIYMQASL